MVQPLTLAAAAVALSSRRELFFVERAARFRLSIATPPPSPSALARRSLADRPAAAQAGHGGAPVATGKAPPARAFISDGRQRANLSVRRRAPRAAAGYWPRAP